jgi:hypothetical protein
MDQQHEGAGLYHRGAFAHHMACFAAAVFLNDLIHSRVEFGLKAKK